MKQNEDIGPMLAVYGFTVEEKQNTSVWKLKNQIDMKHNYFTLKVIIYRPMNRRGDDGKFVKKRQYKVYRGARLLRKTNNPQAAMRKIVAMIEETDERMLSKGERPYG